MPTLCSDSHGTPHAVAYGISSYDSNSMKSSNPHSGIYEASTSRTLDLNGGNPSCNQGGIAIVEPIGFDGYNSADTGDKAATLGVNCGMSTGRNGVVVPYTMKIRSGCEGGGKGALVQTDKSATLSTLNDQYLFQPVTLEPGIAAREGGQVYEGVSGTLRANAGDNQMAVAYCLDDQGGSQISVRTDGKCPTLRAEMHGNVPCVLKEQHPEAISLLGDKVSGTLMARDYKGIGRYDTFGSAVCIPTFVHNIACGVDCRNATEYPELAGALQADAAHNLNSNNVVRVKYIVRRLTPTECARLQGFPDAWGHPDVKEDLTDEEYQFWLNVRNTHAAINDKAAKEYTKEQMLKWYNSLHTDSSEYKMWGNGIALPNALYVMQGIADVMESEQKAARKKWLDALLGDCL